MSETAVLSPYKADAKSETKAKAAKAPVEVEVVSEAKAEAKADVPSRQPKIGDSVYFWRWKAGKLDRPTPGVILELAADGATAVLALFMIGYLHHELKVAYSAEPKMGCWTYPE